MVHTLDGSAAHLHEVLNVIYDLAERGVGVRSLAGPLQINIADEGMGTSRSFCWPCSPKWERTFTAERAACAPAVAGPTAAASTAPGLPGRQNRISPGC